MSLDDNHLESLLRHYASFDEPDQARILATVIKNYRRSIHDDDRARQHRWESEGHELTKTGVALARVTAIANQISGHTPAVHNSRRSSTLLADLGTAVAGQPLTAEAQLGLAVALHANGLPPLLTYAFNAWQVHARSPTDLGRRLAELMVMGLYRLAEQTDPTHTGLLLGSGAVAEVVQTPDGRVTKLPKNYAARVVLLAEEFTNYRILACAGLGERIPRDARYDVCTQSLSHEYVRGQDGETILRDRNELTPQQRDDLRDLHQRLCGVTAKDGLVLDLHPGNFVWDNHSKRWILVDLGPVPSIGSEEYFDVCFEDYYQGTWLDRLEREQLEPIRSVDYGHELTRLRCVTDRENCRSR
ncbi:hypothetical protein AB4305_03495 [Nocardia sp. 2YAB30]|uniref:hypothetical protein n=1 Tax=unclassified Nocardia TaxID=2637762 RepID=UPI003F9E1A5E